MFFSYHLALTENGVKSEDVHDCMAWAFGEDYRNYRFSEEDIYWNKLHSDIHVINGSDRIIDSYKKIAELYLEYKKHLTFNNL
jgi:hypothetical protein